MINLKIAGRIFFQADGTLGAIARHKLSLDVFWNALSPAKPVPTHPNGVTKAVGSDLPPIAPHDAKGDQGDSLFADITGGSWRVIVAVEFFEFFGGYVTIGAS